MNIFVAKLSRNTTADDLIRLFEPFGEVVSAKVIVDRVTGNSKGYGFVEMASEEEGEKAIAGLNETTYQEAVIVIKKAHPREERPPQRRTVIRKNHDNPDEDNINVDPAEEIQ